MLMPTPQAKTLSPRKPDRLNDDLGAAIVTAPGWRRQLDGKSLIWRKFCARRIIECLPSTPSGHAGDAASLRLESCARPASVPAPAAGWLGAPWPWAWP